MFPLLKQTMGKDKRIFAIDITHKFINLLLQQLCASLSHVPSVDIIHPDLYGTGKLRARRAIRARRGLDLDTSPPPATLHGSVELWRCLQAVGRTEAGHLRLGETERGRAPRGRATPLSVADIESHAAGDGQAKDPC